MFDVLNKKQSYFGWHGVDHRCGKCFPKKKCFFVRNPAKTHLVKRKKVQDVAYYFIEREGLQAREWGARHTCTVCRG